jgi:predicted RNA-binding Zn-ribbon protein involved in translation (DUF1610 family)
MAKHKEGTLKEGDDQQEKEFVCDQCGKVYGNYKSWFYHVKSHSVIYQCQTCPRGFKTPRGLKYHMALHTGIAAFHCGECGKAFITRDKLILHQNHGIQTSDRTRANGAAKVSYSHTNWPNIDEESTRAKNPSNATCATRDSRIQVLCHIIASVTLA